ncbi:MAG: GSCFA domain-containing protein [Bacteroidota bacterium]
MLPFRTVLPATIYPFQINHQDKLLSLGSCFTENIGNRLLEAKFDISINPFGILYHPIAIAQHLNRIINDLPFPEDALFQHESYWYSHLHHSSFVEKSKADLLDLILQKDEATKNHLLNSNRIILTFGTAKIYHHLEWDGVVANCHKLPRKAFEARLLKVEEIVELYLPLLEQLCQKREVQLIFTLSPVRHIRDGIIENQRSKAILLLAIHEICDQIKQAHYFPAYELLMDDLRNYRFYEDDLVHPSEAAIAYIWNYFQQSFFDDTTAALLKEIQILQKAAAHRAFHPESIAHQNFLKKQLQKVAQLKERHPHLALEDLKTAFKI